MSRSHTALAILVVLLAFLAVVLGLYGLLVWRRSDVALTGAILLLGLAQLLSIVWRRRHGQLGGSSQRDNGLAESQRRLAELGADSAALGEKLVEIEGRLVAIERFTPPQSPQLEQHVDEIEGAINAFAGRPATAVALPDQPAAPPVRRPEWGPQRPEVELFLEPIVRIKEARTVYYRASLAEPGADGTYIPVRKTPALDFECFRQVVPVARRFRARNRIIGIFCPLSPASFSDEDFIARLLALIRQERDVAGGLVVDITQKGLASLEESGLEGLAWLAELGATFSMSQTDVAGPDIPALSHLGFQFIDIDAGIIARAATASNLSVREPALKLFREAGEHGVSVIAANVAGERELEAVLGYASLARGPLFSPPRRVLHRAGATTLESAVA
jgi:EAL domain-containing protein (putative c-di-GMP-specific phosphodiesterase class I)